jgi:hypothetical protein
MESNSAQISRRDSAPGGWRNAESKTVFAFTRGGDTEAQDSARRLGAVWAGGSEEKSPEPLDAAIISRLRDPLLPWPCERFARAVAWCAAAFT